MNISTEKTKDCQLRLTVEVDPERVEQHLRSASRRLATKVNIPGFRKGKAPYDVIFRMLGKEALYEETLEELGQEVFVEAIEREGFEPFAQAQLENVSFEPMVLTFLVPLAPEIELKDYREIRVESEDVTISDEDVDKSLEKLREDKAEWEPVQRPVAAGDMAVTHLKAVAGSETLDDDDRAIVVEPGHMYPMPGFHEALVGMKAGETKSFELTYPDDWQDESMMGRTVQFEVILNEVKEKVLPELNEEFATLVGDYDSLDDLRLKVKENLKDQAEHIGLHKIQDTALDQLVDKAEISFPPAVLEQQIDDMIREQDSLVRRQQGISLEDFLKMNGQDMKSWRASLSTEAEKRVKRSLALGKLAEVERLSVTDEERAVQEKLMLDIFREESMTMQQFLATPQGQAIVRREIISRKAMERLVAIVKGEAPELEAETVPGEDSVQPSNEAVQETVEVAGSEPV